MRIVITGASGFVGRRLVSRLSERGDEVVALTRTPAGKVELPGLRWRAWDPDAAGSWQDEIEDADAVVHLAGAPIAQRWTAAAKRRIDASRGGSGGRLVDAIEAASSPPKVYLSASASGYYGADRPGEVLTESSEPGDDWLAGVCVNWEQPALRAAELGAREVRLRFGVVLDRGGGALDKMILPLGAGVARIGAGTNTMAWIHREDVVRLLLRALDDETMAGPYNTVAPEAVSAASLASELGKQMRRPVVPSPVFAVKLGLGEAVVILTGSQHLVPERTLASGF
ncbi:MAG: TIGR01777 family oxidoreductase, partial [Myxococcota bacterium]